MILPCNAGPATYDFGGKKTRTFRPRGEMLVARGGRVLSAAERANPIIELGQGGLSARIFVGLSVGDKHTYSLRDVVDQTIAVRRAQGKLPDATFLAQKGVYTGGTGELVEEDSVQIIVIDVEDTPERDFTLAMQDLGERLRIRFQQESVILEIQRRGVVQAVYSIRA